MNLSDISIIELLPPNLARDKNVRMACEAFDEELRRIIIDIPKIAVIPNLVRKQITDNLLLDLLAWQFHCDFYDTSLPVEKKQEIILKSLDWHTRKGTPSVVEEVVSTVFSRAKTQEWFEYGGHPYKFRIETDEELPDTAAIKKLTRVINSVKNARSFLEKITETNNFDDVIEPTDEDVKTIHRTNMDYASQVIFRNGRVLRDGSTIFDTQLENVFRGGTHYRDGILKRNRTRRVPAVGEILPPLYRRSGPQDLFAIGISEGNYLDKHNSQAFRNGAFIRNGILNRSGYAPYSANDAVHIYSVNVWHTDTLTLTDKMVTIIGIVAGDDIARGYQRNGKYFRNGILRRSSNSIVDPFIANYADALETDNLEIDDALIAVMKYHYFRDGARIRDGSIQRKGMVFIPLE